MKTVSRSYQKGSDTPCCATASYFYGSLKPVGRYAEAGSIFLEAENITNQMLMTFIEKVFVYTGGRVEIVCRFRNPFEESAETFATGIEQSKDCNGEVSILSEKSKDNARQRCYNVNGILELQGKNVGSSGGCNRIQINAAARW